MLSAMNFQPNAKEIYDIVFLGLARDCERTIPQFLAMLDGLSRAGLRYAAIVGEDSSKDKTRLMLLEAEAAGRLQLVDTSFLRGIPERLERMARGRQFLVQTFNNEKHIGRTMAVIDLDGSMMRPPSPESLRECINFLDNSKDVFAVSATSYPSYYDLLAFDSGEENFIGLDRKIRQHEKNPFSYVKLFYSFIYPQQRKLTSQKEIYCISAFNGLCLYRYEDFLHGSYVERSNFDLCEHITFNRSIANSTGKNMMINPRLALATPEEHARKSFFAFSMQRMKKVIPRLLRHLKSRVSK